MKALFPLLALIATASGFPNAADAEQGYGIGVNSCAQFAKSYAATPQMTEELYFTWAQGFLTGLNTSTLGRTGLYRDIEGEIGSQKLLLRSFCDAHPLAQYLEAVVELYSSLPIKKANSN